MTFALTLIHILCFYLDLSETKMTVLLFLGTTVKANSTVINTNSAQESVKNYSISVVTCSFYAFFIILTTCLNNSLVLNIIIEYCFFVTFQEYLKCLIATCFFSPLALTKDICKFFAFLFYTILFIIINTENGITANIPFHFIVYKVFIGF